MKLATGAGYWSAGPPDGAQESILQAERLGFHSFWTAEAYGSDALTPLAWWGAATSTIQLGTGIVQMSARTPAATAMAAITMEHLSGGRFILGLGVSGPQIVEGWYGEPWGKPYWRLRDYIQIMRKVNLREDPVTHDGREYQLPFTGEGALGIGKPLMSIMHTNRELPIWMGSGREATVKLTAELCDGWLPMHFVPGRMDHYRPWVEEGFRRAGNGKSWKDFEIQAGGRVIITDDVKAALAESKPGIALYVGGMGHKDLNFHNEHMVQRGYPDVAERVQELYLAGRKQEAIAAIPDEYVDDAGLYGSVDRIEQRWGAWADSGITGFTVNTHQEEAVELMADLAGTRR